LRRTVVTLLAVSWHWDCTQSRLGGKQF
jgi:hypothetical protein